MVELPAQIVLLFTVTVGVGVTKMVVVCVPLQMPLLPVTVYTDVMVGDAEKVVVVGPFVHV